MTYHPQLMTLYQVIKMPTSNVLAIPKVYQCSYVFADLSAVDRDTFKSQLRVCSSNNAALVV